MNISLEGRTAIVTGAARGIGLAISKKLAAAGASVLLVDIDNIALTDAVEVIADNGGKAAGLAGDLTAITFPQAIVDKAIESFGSLDIIVNNAGYTWDNVIQKMGDEQFQAMLDIHVVAPFRILRSAANWIREVAKQEKAAGAPVVRKVVNITSIAGTDGNAGQAAYSSAKAGIVGLTKTLAKEWGRYQVTVNAVGFGLIDTRLIKPMNGEETHISVGERQVRVGMQADAREQATKQIPLGRLGTAEDAANAVFFFCSPLSDYVTGEVLICSGGLHF